MRYFAPFLLLLLLIGHTAEAQNLFLSIGAKEIVVGERVTVEVKVASRAQSINAVSGALAYPEALLRPLAVSRDGSIVDLWTVDPTIGRGSISFEGVILNPGFQGASGTILRATFEAKKAGSVALSFSKGAVLANDGLGTNILSSLGSGTLRIAEGQLPGISTITSLPDFSRLAALPVITEYSASIFSKDSAYLKGKGEPNALTKIVFKDVSFKSLGERFIDFVFSKRKRLDEALVQNDQTGNFQYESGSGLVAGVFNATPFLVERDSNTEKPGLGVQLLVSNNKIVRALVVLINVLGLLIPVVLLGVIIYFIPWYSFRRMRVLGKKLGLEEEKLSVTGKQIEREYKMDDKFGELLGKQ